MKTSRPSLKLHRNTHFGNQTGKLWTLFNTRLSSLSLIINSSSILIVDSDKTCEYYAFLLNKKSERSISWGTQYKLRNWAIVLNHDTSIRRGEQWQRDELSVAGSMGLGSRGCF